MIPSSRNAHQVGRRYLYSHTGIGSPLLLDLLILLNCIGTYLLCPDLADCVSSWCRALIFGYTKAGMPELSWTGPLTASLWSHIFIQYTNMIMKFARALTTQDYVLSNEAARVWLPQPTLNFSLGVRAFSYLSLERLESSLYIKMSEWSRRPVVD